MKTLPRGIIKRIHVSQPNLRLNRKDGGSRPVFTIQTSQGPLYANYIELRGSSQVVSRPEKPLSCGARIWIETRAEVAYDDKGIARQ